MQLTQLKHLRGLKHLRLEDALRVRYLIHNLKSGKVDGRKLRIRKAQLYDWFMLADEMYKTELYIHETDYDLTDMFDEIETAIEDNHHYYMNKKQKLRFLKMVDDCFVHLLAKLGYYPRSNGSKVVLISQMHPTQYEATVNKLKREYYNIPQAFQPISFKIEED